MINFSTSSLSKCVITASRSFFAVTELLSIVTLGPKAAIGLAEVPSPGATDYVTPMLIATLCIAVDLSFLLDLGSGMAPFPLEPISLGEMSGTSSLGSFSRIITLSQ